MEKSFYRVSAVVFCALIAMTAVAQDACTLNASNTGPYNAGSTVSLNATGDSGDSYAWTGPNGFSSDQQNPMITNADVSRAGDYRVTSNGCTSTTSVVVSEPTITIDNPNAKPGPRGTLTPLTFHIRLSAPSTQTVSVEYYTSNSTAIAGRDYQVTSGTAVFQPGVTEQDVVVNLYGTNGNSQKALFLILYEAENGSIQTIYGYPVKGRGVILAK